MAGIIKIGFLLDWLVTGLHWFCFILLFTFIYWPIFLVGYLFTKKRRFAFQFANHYFFKLFFLLSSLITPGLRYELPQARELAGLRSSIVICNHLSYLDPILLVSLLPRTITIVREDFFKTPIFGWILKNAGYLSPVGTHFDDVWFDRLREQLNVGGNVFIFPEGTRGDGQTLGSFHKGAFYFARKHGTPLELLLVENSHLLFPNGQRHFNTCQQNTVCIQRLGAIDSRELAEAGSSRAVAARVMKIYQEALDLNRSGSGSTDSAAQEPVKKRFN